MFHKSIKNQAGFTLLELLIVIVIIGILAFLVVPGVITAPQKTRDAQRKADLSVIRNALEAYFNDHNAYPLATTTYVPVATNQTIKAALVPTYIKKAIPDDPKAPKRHYVYKCTAVTNGSCTSFQLEASLENSKDPQITDPSFPNGYIVKSLN